MNPSTQNGAFVVYKRRWAVMATVVALNISNAVLWINYAPVADDVSEFYGRPMTDVNYFSLVFIIVAFPFCFISTMLFNNMGLKSGIHLGAILNTTGAVIRAIGTSDLFPDPNTKFAVSLTGQVLAAMAQPFVLFIPTKVSQLWFPEDQRGISTTVLAMSNPLGIVIASAAAPAIITEPSQVPFNNYIWAGLAILAEIMAIVCVTTSHPKTPPSRSAERGEVGRPPYFQQLRNTFSNPAFLLEFLCIGAGIGFFSCMATITEQLLCPLGYSSTVSGVAIAVMVLFGFGGSALTGILVDKTKQFVDIAKSFFGFAALSAIILLELYLVPDLPVLLILAGALFGFFGIGAYPVGLELAVETTYPVEESISTAFIFLSGQLHAGTFIAIVPMLGRDRPLSDAAMNECSTEVGNAFQDYTIGVIVIMCYTTLIITAFMLLLKTPYNRQQAEQRKQHQDETITNEHL